MPASLDSEAVQEVHESSTHGCALGAGSQIRHRRVASCPLPPPHAPRAGRLRQAPSFPSSRSRWPHRAKSTSKIPRATFVGPRQRRRERPGRLRRVVLLPPRAPGAPVVARRHAAGSTGLWVATSLVDGAPQSIAARALLSIASPPTQHESEGEVLGPKHAAPARNPRKALCHGVVRETALARITDTWSSRLSWVARQAERCDSDSASIVVRPSQTLASTARLSTHRHCPRCWR
jgi:hypothetical protein